MTTAVWVGYPKDDIQMNGLYFGRNVDGGTFPADIWGDYMGRDQGQLLRRLHAARRSRSSASPFTASTPVRRRRPTTRSRRTAPTAPDGRVDETDRRAVTPDDTGGEDGPDGGTPDEGFDPGAYETPPQPEPDTVAPPPADGDGGATAPG